MNSADGEFSGRPELRVVADLKEGNLSEVIGRGL